MKYTKAVISLVSAGILAFGGNTLAQERGLGRKLSDGKQQKQELVSVDKIVKVNFVQQSFDGGKSMFGYHVQWRLDKEEKDVRRVCKELDAYNKQYAKEHGYDWYNPSKSEFYMSTACYKPIITKDEFGKKEEDLEFLSSSEHIKLIPATMNHRGK